MVVPALIGADGAVHHGAHDFGRTLEQRMVGSMGLN